MKWGSCCPTCQAVWVTSSPVPLSWDATTHGNWNKKNVSRSNADDALHLLFPSSASVFASVSSCERLPLMYLHHAFTCAVTLVHAQLLLRASCRSSISTAVLPLNTATCFSPLNVKDKYEHYSVPGGVNFSRMPVGQKVQIIWYYH